MPSPSWAPGSGGSGSRSRVVFLLMLYPLYSVLTAANVSMIAIFTANMLGSFVYAMGIGAAYAFMAEAFPQAVRSSGLSILYATGVAVFGGTTQFVVAWLIRVTDNPMVPAWYQIAATVVSIAGILLLVPHAEVVRERTAHAAALPERAG